MSDLLTYDTLNTLTISEVSDLIKNRLVIPRTTFRPKKVYFEYILDNASPELRLILKDAVTTKATKKFEVQGQRAAERKRKRNNAQNSRRTAARAEAEIEEVRDVSKFLQLPSEARVKECYHQFYEATSNAAVRLVVCAICAREVNARSDGVTECHLSALPNSHRLIPKHSHPAHDLYDERLLEPQGVIDLGNRGTVVRVCRDCLAELKEESDKPPTYSLANNLWIGRVVTRWNGFHRMSIDYY
jgi:hypothetical protein